MHADKIFINGNIITMKDLTDRTSCIAVKDSRIIGMGDDLKHFTGSNTEVIDLGGRTVVPGFFDCHNHIIEGAKTYMWRNLRDCSSRAELKDVLLDEYGHTDEWVVGIGWQDKIFEGKKPTSNELDDIIRDKPVYLIRSDGHCVWVNTLAYRKLKDAGFNPMHKGTSVVDEGSKMGFYYEADYDDAIDKLLKLLPEEFYIKSILKVNEWLLKSGVTFVDDIMTTYPELFKLYRRLIDEGKLKLRLRCGMRPPMVEEFLGLKDIEDDRLKIGHIKYFLDGTFGSRTAMLMEPYEDDKDNMGFQIIPDDELNKIVEDSLSMGRQISIHAIGDRAVNLILNAYEKAYGMGLVNTTRNRIEHLQIIKESDIERLKKFGIVASFQPAFLYEHDLTLSRVGQRRLKDTYRYKTLVEKGIPIILDSDYPYGGDNYPKKPDGENYKGFEPILGINAATSSVHVNQAEKISVYDALKAYTVNAAYVNFVEKDLGTIEEGKFADMVVLSKDIMSMDVEDIINTEVVATVIGGEIVYNNGL